MASHVACEADKVHGQRCEGGGEEGTLPKKKGGHQKREQQGCHQRHRDEEELSRVILGTANEVRLVVNLASVCQLITQVADVIDM